MNIDELWAEFLEVQFFPSEAPPITKADLDREVKAAHLRYEQVDLEKINDDWMNGCDVPCFKPSDCLRCPNQVIGWALCKRCVKEIIKAEERALTARAKHLLPSAELRYRAKRKKHFDDASGSGRCDS